MFNSRSHTFSLAVISLFIVGFIVVNVKTAQGSPDATRAAQTVPTRTPIPPTAGPSQPSQPSQPSVTATPANTATPTTIPTRTPTYTPVPTIFVGVTAEPCGSQPTVWAISTANLRSGPGMEYPIIGNLIYNEARAIVGRAQDAEWWLLPLSETETAWVANIAVTVQGDVSHVPVVPAPPLNGVTPTAAAVTWNPTPNPMCPTAVPPTETPTAAPAADAASAAETPPPAVSAETAVSEAAVSPSPTIAPTATIIVEPTAMEPTAVPPTAMPLDNGVNDESAGASNFLFIGGGLLLLSGLALLLFKRKS